MEGVKTGKVGHLIERFNNPATGKTYIAIYSPIVGL